MQNKSRTFYYNYTALCDDIMYINIFPATLLLSHDIPNVTSHQY